MKKSKSKRVKARSIADEYVKLSSDETITDGFAAVKIKRIYDSKEYFASMIEISGMDIFNQTQTDKEAAYKSFALASSALDTPHKYVFSEKRTNLSAQKEMLQYKAAKTSDDFKKFMLQKRLDEMQYIENTHREKLTYLIVYSENKRKLENQLAMFLRNMTCVCAKICSEAEIWARLKKFASFLPDDSEEMQNITSDKVYPEKVVFKQEYFKTGGRYAASLIVNDYPAYLPDLLLASYNLQDENLMITIDVMKQDKDEMKRQISFSLDELNSRGAINQKVSSAIDTVAEFEKISSLYADISNGKEQIFGVTIRFFVSADDRKDLQKKQDNLIHMLSDDALKAYIPINQMQKEYFSLLLPSNPIQTPFPLYDTYARQYPFYYQQIIDRTGSYFGETSAGGLAIIDTFQKDDNRSSYDMLFIGQKGSGKTMTLKAMLEDQLILGNKALVLDIEGEFSRLAQMYGGKVVRMTQKSIINPLQLMKVIDRDAENYGKSEDSENFLSEKEAIAANLTSEISRINTFMRLLSPNFDDEDESKFDELLDKCYRLRGIDKTTDLSELAPDSFPTFSDVLSECETALKNASSNREIEICQKLISILKRISKGGVYEIFDNATNIDIGSSDLIVFDVRSISEMEEKVYNAQLFSLLSIMWAEVCRNIKYNWGIVNPYDRKKVVCLIDEAHRFLSEKAELTLDFIEKLTRRSRKYSAGLWFASQSILDFFSDGVGSQSDAAKKVRVIFSLVQYKFILKQDAGAVEDLKSAFPNFSESQLAAAPGFVPGEMLVGLDSNTMKLRIRRLMSTAQLMYMGTSLDVSNIINNLFEENFILNNNPDSYTELDYGVMIYENEQTYSDFIDLFSQYVLEEIGFPKETSAVIDNLVIGAVKSLADSLVEKAEALRFKDDIPRRYGGIGETNDEMEALR